MSLITPPPTMTSREIAELTDSNHFNVLSTIRALVDRGVISGNETPYTHPQNGQTYTEFHLSYRDTLVVVSGYSVELRARIIDRWQELEKQQAGGHDLETEEGKLLMIKQLAEQRLIALQDNKRLTMERDQAIATKAEIGSRREATAMQTAATARKEAAKLQDELGRSCRHATVIAVQNATGRVFGDQDWRALKRWCTEHGAAPEQVPDKRYGFVRAWPAGAWMDVYRVDLVALFPAPATETV